MKKKREREEEGKEEREKRGMFHLNHQMNNDHRVLLISH